MNVKLAHLDSKIWAILPAYLDAMRSSFAQSDNDVITPKASKSLEPTGGLQYGFVGSDGVATINVNGVLYNPDGYIDEILEFYFGGVSIPALIRDIDAVLNDSSVKAVVFNFHSPGGEVFGINEAADKIAALTAKKTTTAYCYGYCCSAAYFLAAKCGEIVTDAQAVLGSIGVVCAWYDLTGAYELMGIAYEEVTSEGAPYKRLDIRKPEERAVFMDEINGIETVFHKSVAKGRGVSIDTVRTDFGKGAVMAGHLAVKAGLADRTGSLDEVVRELSRNRTKTATATAAAEGDIDMSFKEEFKKFAAACGFTAQENEGGDPDTDNAADERDPAAEPASEPAEEPANDEGGDKDKAATASAQVEVEASAALEAVKKMKADAITAQADAFVDGELKAGRLFPSEKATMHAMFVQAANDDDAAPLKSGSRVDALKANQAVRQSHGLTEEVVDAEANQVVLAAIGGGGQVSADRQTELLESSPLGKAALKLVKKAS